MGSEEEFKADGYVDYMMKVNKQAKESLLSDSNFSLTEIFYGDSLKESLLIKKRKSLEEILMGSTKPSLTALFLEEDEQPAPDLEDTAQEADDESVLNNVPKNLMSSIKNEKILLKDTFTAKPNNRALVVGGTQSSKIGPTVIQALASKGFNNNNDLTGTTKSMKQSIETASNIPDADSYDIVLIYPGFNTGDGAGNYMPLLQKFEPARCFFIIPPPVTTVGDTAKSKASGLNKGKDVPDSFWFDLKDGQYAEQREDFCDNLASLVTANGATAIDPRDVIAGGVAQPTGVNFPNMEDGIHPSGAMIQTIANEVIKTIFGTSLKVTASSVLSKIKLADLKRDPGCINDFKKYPEIYRALTTVASKLGIPTNVTKRARSAQTGQVWKVSSEVGGRGNPLFPGKRENHQGMDIAVPVGTPVAASMDGVVKFVGLNHKDAGNYIELKHPNNDMTRYLHLSQVNVTRGQQIRQGDIIGLSGGEEGAPGSGASTGPHLHWETWQDGNFKTGTLLNPRDWLSSNTDAVKPVNFA